MALPDRISLLKTLLAFNLLVSSLIAQETNPSYTIDPPASWVQITSPAASAQPFTNNSDGVVYLLVDRQVDLASESVFRREVKRITTENGVQNESQLEFNFEPSHQSLVLHTIQIRRNGRVINQLKPEILRVIQQERDSFRHIYNGEVSVHAVLEDVRAGDEIESSHTVRGFNPIFENRYADTFLIRFSVPVLENRLRIIAPKERPPLHFRAFGWDAAPAIRENGPTLEYDWTFRDLAPLRLEDKLPVWSTPFPWLQLTEYASWQQVRDWALAHYGPLANVSGEAVELIEQLRKDKATIEAQALAALRFVQEEVRYLGIEIGSNSHKPHDPSLVLARRFGDCKDKTVLLAALFHRLGIEAHPALVNTYLRGKLLERLPSPLNFNHVILRAVIDGQTYWLDPTLTHQRGNLHDVSVDNYRHALVVQKGENSLVSIPEKAHSTPAKIVRETLSVHRYGGPADLKVETIFTGAEADSMRQWASRSSMEELQKDYLNYYLRSYSGITNTAPVEIIDDTAANQLITIEQYSIEQLWDTPARSSDDYSTSFDATAIIEATPLPRISDRTMPLGLRYPMHVRHILSIDLPNPGEFPDENSTVEDAFQRFEYTGKHVGKNLLLTFEYQSLANAVPVEKVSTYLKNLNKIHEICTYEAIFPQNASNGDSGGIHWPTLAIAAMAAMILTFGVVKGYQWRPAPPVSIAPPELIEPRLHGLRGWLILVGLGLCASPIRILRTMSEALPAYSPESWRYLTHPASAGYHWLYEPMLIGELIGNLTLLAMTFLLLLLFFAKRRTFPRLYIAFVLFSLFFQFADLGAMSAIPALAKDLTPRDYGRTFGTLVGTTIWIAYMQTSKRVKATFVQ